MSSQDPSSRINFTSNFTITSSGSITIGSIFIGQDTAPIAHAHIAGAVHITQFSFPSQVPHPTVGPTAFTVSPYLYDMTIVMTDLT